MRKARIGFIQTLQGQTTTAQWEFRVYRLKHSPKPCWVQDGLKESLKYPVFPPIPWAILILGINYKSLVATLNYTWLPQRKGLCREFPQGDSIHWLPGSVAKMTQNMNQLEGQDLTLSLFGGYGSLLCQRPHELYKHNPRKMFAGIKQLWQNQGLHKNFIFQDDTTQRTQHKSRQTKHKGTVEKIIT